MLIKLFPISLHFGYLPKHHISSWFYWLQFNEQSIEVIFQYDRAITHYKLPVLAKWNNVICKFAPKISSVPVFPMRLVFYCESLWVAIENTLFNNNTKYQLQELTFCVE